MKRERMDCDTPWNYEVVGEHVSDFSRLLVRADDGRYYALDLSSCEIEPAILDGQWSMPQVKLPGDIKPLDLA